jgi:hypothetical protein
MFRRYLCLTGAFLFGCCCPTAEFPAISECKLENAQFLKLEGVKIGACFSPNHVDLHATVANPQIKTGSDLRKTDVGVWVELSLSYFLVEITKNSIKFYDGTQDSKDKLNTKRNLNRSAYGNNAYCFECLPALVIQKLSSYAFKLDSNYVSNFIIMNMNAYTSKIKVDDNVQLNRQDLGKVKKVNDNGVDCLIRDSITSIILKSGDIITFGQCDTDFAFFTRELAFGLKTVIILYLCPVGPQRRSSPLDD